MPAKGHFLGFDHMHFWVGNAPQAAAYYVTRFGFEPYAYRGLETGSRQVTTYVIRQKDVMFAFSSALVADAKDLGHFVSTHGDGVKEVAFRVDDCKAVFDRAVENGAEVVREVETKAEVGANGTVTTGTVKAGWGGEAWNTFVERRNYDGIFMPGFSPVGEGVGDPLIGVVESPRLSFIDHCVVNVADGKMEEVVNWYVDVLGFHRFWSVDDKQLHTEFSSLRSIVVADWHEKVKMPINEPASGRRKSQIQEFVEYFSGPGVQHIALNTPDIISAISKLRKRGVGFIKVPITYYDDLRQRLKSSSTKVEEDMNELQKLGILVDFDESGYLLQIFTKPLQDRPTLFIEIIQRHSHSGFGVGNFKSLFEAIEREQALRGNL